MNKLVNDRRTFIAFIAILALTSLGIYTVDSSVAMAIATVAAALAGANAYAEGKKGPSKDVD
jgi:hypothetical protein